MKDRLNNTINGVKRFLKRVSLILLLIVGIASAAIIVVNHYSIRILSAARAYINGESQYSKGQKDATAHLINYIYQENNADYTAFIHNIDVCRGDRMARVALSSDPADYQTARKGLLQGRNHPDDIGDMMWLFVNFKNLDLFKKPIVIWAQGDAMINDLYHLGERAHQSILSGKFSENEKHELLQDINNNTIGITLKERAFSTTLGTTCRIVNVYIFWANVLIMLVIVVSSLLFAAIMIRNLANSKKVTIERNEELQRINTGLDKFVYNVTHDLRSPLASMIGLIELMDEEMDIDQIKDYAMMMKDSLVRQDQYIREMLEFIRSKHNGLRIQDCSLLHIIDNVIALNSFKKGSREVQIYKDIGLSNIESDALKLQVILNNLVSNSIKYSDASKTEQWIKVKTYRANAEAVIEVEDNGLGIKKNDQDRIFDKFYFSGDNKHSSGIGLYLVKDAVSQLKGKIEVRSEPGISSTFMISLPFSSQ